MNINKELNRRLEALNTTLIELARTRDEWDASPEPVDDANPLRQAFERALVEYEAADEEMVEYMAHVTGREIRQAPREPMNPPQASAGRQLT